ncbi:MAG: hypothetical protein JHC84_15210 [Solirubrobacteraceae bacterium]|nr:hypothetical protein [Solirubrobacteraceae bacterium]
MPRRHPKPRPRRGAGSAEPRIDVERVARQAAQRREACAAKVRYDTEAEARSFAIMHSPGRGPRATPYLCDVCDGWHLTRG